MALDVRDFAMIGQFAKKAQTTIPAIPISGQAYRNPGVSKTQIELGQAYDHIGPSAFWNQLLYLATGIARHSEQFAFVPWSAFTDYTGDASWCLGQDGTPYHAIADSGPGDAANPGIGAKPPPDEEYWETLAYYVNRMLAVGGGVGTYPPTPNRLALRNALGCTQVSDPVEELDAANRRWVWHMIQQHGIAPWRDSVTYDPLPWLVWGSDGMIYVALQPSGPGLANIGPKDPTATAGYWLAFTGYILNDAGFAEAVARTPKPAVLVAKTTAPQSLTNGAAQKIAFDTVSYDQTAFGAETGWDAGNNRWRCPQAGRWLVQYDPYIVYSGWSGTNFYNRIYKNGDMSTLVAGNAMGGGSGSGGPLSAGVYIFAALDMALGDYLECYNFFVGAGTTSVAAGTSFKAVML